MSVSNVCIQQGIGGGEWDVTLSVKESDVI